MVYVSNFDSAAFSFGCEDLNQIGLSINSTVGWLGPGQNWTSGLGPTPEFGQIPGLVIHYKTDRRKANYFTTSVGMCTLNFWQGFKFVQSYGVFIFNLSNNL